MSEHEKTLRQELHETTQNAQASELWLHVRMAKMTEAFYALLSEHRAEVELLTAELENHKSEAEAHNAAATQYESDIRDLKARIEMVERRWADASAERSSLREQLSSARDAALEEARRAVSGTRMGNASASEVRSMDIDAIRALKSHPAERYLRESEVREVLVAVRHKWGSRGGRRTLLANVARDIGVDLDADAQS